MIVILIFFQMSSERSHTYTLPGYWPGPHTSACQVVLVDRTATRSEENLCEAPGTNRVNRQ